MRAFISYAHADEKHLDRLHKHMAMLVRDGIIEAWSDHQIIPGGKLADEINRNLVQSGLFIALLSADYLASNYCYEKEFGEAQKLATAGKLRIVPVILEPCEWLSSPFGEFLALPKDGTAISEWTNQNVAYLDVVKGLRRLVADEANHAVGAAGGVMVPSTGGPRRVKVKQEFDAIQRGDFADEAFDVIRTYFQGSCVELNGVEDLKAKFEIMNDKAFTCTVVNRGIKGGQEAHITIRNLKGRGHFGDINYVYESHAESNTSNGSIRVDADDYNLFLVMDDFYHNTPSKYDARQVSEKLWLNFVQQAGIDYA